MAYTTPPTFAAAAILTAAQLNTYLRDNFKAIGDAMTSTTPTYTNFSLGNGTVSAAYAQVGKWVRYRGVITMGSTSSVTGTLRISLPVTSVVNTFGRPMVGNIEVFDTSGSDRRFWVPAHQSGTEFYVASQADVRADATTPWTWATGDLIAWHMQYEAA